MNRPFVLLAAFLMGCGKLPVSPAAEAVVVDSAGVSIVTSHVPAWPTGGGWQVDSQPITVIGADDNDIQQQWRWVESAARFSNGNVVVGVEGSLRVFGPDGKSIRLLSKAGDGPGEFQNLAELLVLPGDSLRANDHMGRRIATYAPDGALVRDVRIDMARFQALGHWTECQKGLLPRGYRFGCQVDKTLAATATNRPSVVDGEGMSSPGPGLYRGLRRVYVATPDLSAAYPLGVDGGIEQFGVSVGKGEVFIVHPFHSRSFIAAGGGAMRIAIATNPEYRIELWTPAGKLERIIRREGGRRAPTAAERAAAPAAMKRYLDRMDPATGSKVLAAVPTPDSLPPAVGLTVTPPGGGL